MHSIRSKNPASEAEIRSAIETLSRNHGELLLLRRYALQRMRISRVTGGAFEPHDFVHQAVLLTLRGQRTWQPGRVNFLGHLFGAIKSVVSHVAEQQHGPRKAKGEEPRPPTAQERDRDPSPTPTEAIDPCARLDDGLDAGQHLSLIEQAIAHDPPLLRFARSVAIHGGKSAPGPLIKADLGISESQYRALRARLCRALERIFGDPHE